MKMVSFKIDITKYSIGRLKVLGYSIFENIIYKILTFSLEGLLQK